MSDNGKENREYERYPASLKVHVFAMDAAGERFTESGFLKDISGGGANLVAEEPEKFFVGQKIDLQIHLPHEEALGTNIKGHGMVVWVGEEDPKDQSKRASIGICLNDLLAFENLINKGSE